MSDKSIPFKAPMVRALLECRKTQERLVMKWQPRQTENEGWYIRNSHSGVIGLEEHEVPSTALHFQPYEIGMRLWVREAFSGFDFLRSIPPRDWPLSPIWYWADGNPSDKDWTRPKPSIYMPRWASRLTLIVTDVRVQRLQDISEEDAIVEGADLARADGRLDPTFRLAFSNLWNSIYGPEAWEANPWVSAITFTVHNCNIDQMARAA